MMLRIRTHISLVCITLFLFAAASAQEALVDSVINKELISRLISTLAADSMKGRSTGTKENARAAEFIADEFRKAGLRPLTGNNGYYMSFDVPFRIQYNVRATIGYNVIAALPGKSKPNEIVVFSAHYDHIGTDFTFPYKQPDKEIDRNDSIYNGANDNASGVAAIIALANYYGQLQNNERTILFIAFSGEELGLLGSYAFVKNINPEYFVAVLNLEMLGRSNTGGANGRPYITGYRHSNLRDMLNHELASANERKYGKRYFQKDGYGDQALFTRSDNYPFAELGIPAHTIMAGSPLDSRYHTVYDEYESLNINMMASIVRAIALAATPLLTGSSTPNRIDPRKIEFRKVF